MGSKTTLDLLDNILKEKMSCVSFLLQVWYGKLYLKALKQLVNILYQLNSFIILVSFGCTCAIYR